LNNDLVAACDTRRKLPAVAARVTSIESKTLLDGKSNGTRHDERHRACFYSALMMVDEPVRIKDVTVTREPASPIVFIRGLTRPFTLTQLKELLGRYGTFVDGEFWLDKIKSQCFVTVRRSCRSRPLHDACRSFSTQHWKKRRMLAKASTVAVGRQPIRKHWQFDSADKTKSVDVFSFVGVLRHGQRCVSVRFVFSSTFARRTICHRIKCRSVIIAVGTVMFDRSSDSTDDRV
jgi:hypothetical protein